MTAERVSVIVSPEYKCTCGDPKCDLNKFAREHKTKVNHWKNLPPDIEPLV